MKLNIDWIVIYPVDNTIQRVNNPNPEFSSVCGAGQTNSSFPCFDVSCSDLLKCKPFNIANTLNELYEIAVRHATQHCVDRLDGNTLLNEK